MKEELKCPKCNSSQTRYRIKTNDRYCYFCGHPYKLEEKKIIENSEDPREIDG